MDDDIFYVKARHCKRCGRLLTSGQAVKDGYGCTCKKKTRAEVAARRPLSGQMTIGDYLKEDDFIGK